MEHLAQLKRRKLRHALEIVRNADATVRQQMDEVQEEGEYELDLDKLSAETLFALHEYVEKHCNPKLKLVVSSPAAAVRNTTLLLLLLLLPAWCLFRAQIFALLVRRASGRAAGCPAPAPTGRAAQPAEARTASTSAAGRSRSSSRNPRRRASSQRSLPAAKVTRKSQSRTRRRRRRRSRRMRRRQRARMSRRPPRHLARLAEVTLTDALHLNSSS